MRRLLLAATLLTPLWPGPVLASSHREAPAVIDLNGDAGAMDVYVWQPGRDPLNGQPPGLWTSGPGGRRFLPGTHDNLIFTNFPGCPAPQGPMHPHDVPDIIGPGARPIRMVTPNDIAPNDVLFNDVFPYLGQNPGTAPLGQTLGQALNQTTFTLNVDYSGQDTLIGCGAGGVPPSRQQGAPPGAPIEIGNDVPSTTNVPQRLATGDAAQCPDSNPTPSGRPGLTLEPAREARLTGANAPPAAPAGHVPYPDDEWERLKDLRKLVGELDSTDPARRARAKESYDKIKALTGLDDAKVQRIRDEIKRRDDLAKAPPPAGATPPAPPPAPPPTPEIPGVPPGHQPIPDDEWSRLDFIRGLVDKLDSPDAATRARAQRTYDQVKAAGGIDDAQIERIRAETRRRKWIADHPPPRQPTNPQTTSGPIPDAEWERLEDIRDVVEGLDSTDPSRRNAAANAIENLKKLGLDAAQIKRIRDEIKRRAGLSGTKTSANGTPGCFTTAGQQTTMTTPQNPGDYIDDRHVFSSNFYLTGLADPLKQGNNQMWGDYFKTDPGPAETSFTASPAARGVACDGLNPCRPISGLKIADNSAPLPADRSFYQYDYFDTLGQPSQLQSAASCGAPPGASQWAGATGPASISLAPDAASQWDWYTRSLGNSPAPVTPGSAPREPGPSPGSFYSADGTAIFDPSLGWISSGRGLDRLPPLPTGDYDGDGNVDVADFNAWRQNFSRPDLGVTSQGTASVFRGANGADYCGYFVPRGSDCLQAFGPDGLPPVATFSTQTAFGGQRITSFYAGNFINPEGGHWPRPPQFIGNAEFETILRPQAAAPDDPLAADGTQWALSAIGWLGADGASVAPAGGAPVIVAVVDSGIDPTHPELRGRIAINEREIPNNGIDDDHNGHVDDVLGWNFYGGNNDVRDFHGHGTVVAGLIAAAGNNGQGIAGIAPNARILPVKVASYDGTAGSFDIALGIAYAADRGARVINVSYGGKGGSKFIGRAIDYATAHGALVVIAAGNEGQELKGWQPAGHPAALTVAATNRKDGHAGYSNWGAAVDLAAPGDQIVSLRATGTDLLKLEKKGYAPGSAVVAGDYYQVDGTSFSAPIAAGVAAMVLSANPGLSPAELKRVLVNSARDVDTPGRDNYTGAGIVNAAAALGGNAGFFVDAAISGVEVAREGKKTFVEVRGTAAADQLAGTEIAIGRGEEPVSFRKVDGGSAGVSDGILGRIDAGELKGAPVWIIRLTVRHANGETREARFRLKLN